MRRDATTDDQSGWPTHQTLPPVGHSSRLRAAYLKRWRRLWRAMGAAVIGALLLVGVAQWLHAHTTALPPAPIQLAWQSGTAPAGSVTAPFLGGAAPAIAPSDGATAYSCVTPTVRPGATPSPSAPVRILLTHDRARHWTSMANLPLAPQAVTACQLEVDAERPTTVLAIAFFGDPTAIPAASQGASFVTTDGAKTWRTLSDPQMVFTQAISTRGQITYALRCCEPTGATSEGGLFASDDGMRSWRPIGQPLLATDFRIEQFWLRSDTGELLAMTWGAMSSDQRNLWRSADGGAHWTKLHTPFASAFYVQTPRDGAPWHSCGVTYLPGLNANAPNTLICSADGGANWQPGPTLNSTTDSEDFAVIAIADDGAVVATRYDSPTQFTLYRLASGFNDWQSLGKIPTSAMTPGYSPVAASTVTYVAAPGGGVLWATPNYPSTSAASRLISTAGYPG